MTFYRVNVILPESNWHRQVICIGEPYSEEILAFQEMERMVLKYGWDNVIFQKVTIDEPHQSTAS
jgi:hypothetical protein